MKSFIWGSYFETGLVDVDDQHRKLVELINCFGDKLVNNEITNRDVEGVLQELVSYTRYHFAEEEKMMAKYQLEQNHYDGHIAEHMNFIDDVVAIHQHRQEDNLADGAALLEFLIHWLAYHILGSDKNMARQIASIKQGATPSAAYLAEEKKVNESTEPLLGALKGLFQQVSRRNKELLSLNVQLEAKVEERTRELVKANATLEILAMTDVLTELPNRRHALIQLHRLWREAKELDGNLACMVIDADNFKTINDTYGHDAGDCVLKRLAKALQHSVRSDDIVCRMGGDEFLIICPNTPLQGALYIAEQTRRTIADLNVKAGTGIWKGSISVGVAAISSEIDSIDDLLKAADDGVYLAKESGRNRIETIQKKIDYL